MADETTEQKHTEITKKDTSSIKKIITSRDESKLSLDEQRVVTEAAIDISKARRRTIEGLITVSDDLKVVDKDQLTAKKALTDQVKGAGMSIVQGAEGFVTGMFGGPIGGIINALSVGFLTRWITNKKEASAQAERDKKADEKAAKLNIFGSPTYVIEGEIFWGQDRLDLLEEFIQENL